ncbi:hypothetical protein AGRA3207_000635 [Actinomadura graeca]|uniref:Uncharacterized protein n=1 Tax=Actinomadura graeca TaxID=2750812 RepID=A0ABX8QMU3_9ACTN|nr:hypothetical protein [Actinomadura graeca]QXJ20008.1 hypothetical protein AGRA3207_000635 [Actinomadura graeca]
MVNTTYRSLAGRLAALGMASEDEAAAALAALGEPPPDPDDEPEEADVLDVLDECGLLVWVPAGDVGNLEEGYREVLESAAECGAVPVSGVELVEDEDGEESLHFLRDGEPVWWAVEHEAGDRLDLLTVMECIDDLEPRGGDPRMFYALPGEEQDEDDVYVLATPEQARALHDDFGLDLEGLDRVKPPSAGPPDAEPGTLDWYMQSDRGRMTGSARDFLDGWTSGMDAELARWRSEYLPEGFPFDFSPASLDELEPIVLERLSGWDSVIASGGDPFVSGAVRYLGESMLREVPSRWGYQDLGLSDAYDRIPMIRSNTPQGFTQTVVPLHRLAALAKERERGMLAESSRFLQDAVDAHRKAVAARRA